ncbi:acetylglutamate kinase [Anaerotignum propionicum]|uniref:Acetylglutamate kinase n=1 Tax=Anaerotignum propionicum DSM 1682 TaxID=991789 RepID=A0A110A6J4_ANAPI|nr:acetylglutamate kinase [Anaerotignum propionicum]AMJ39657.1 acetylglutamate kinase [Anaerotignum propionicum DSM 1682]SHE30948.1 N-acetylglutamate kinase [[Clostridium] propionicum DSM 1682] [Anaerotignum propionicum DSM 1682]
MVTDCNNIKAKVLTAALPYIQKYTGRTVVIKYGGNAMIHQELKKAVMSDIILLSLVGIHVVLVHGGGPEISGMLKKLDIPSRFIDGLRYTDEETAEVVQMVLAGKTNKDLVSLIGQLGGKAIGLCGIDGGMIKAKKIQGDYGYVGEITEINTEPITQAIQSGYIPVIATVGTDCKGQTYNINADTAAAEIAAALQAENIITLTDIRGLMRDISDENSLIPVVKIDEVETLINDGIISGGMIPKVKSLKKSVLSGVEKAVMIDGRIVHSILIEMFSDEGVGTMFMK